MAAATNLNRTETRERRAILDVEAYEIDLDLTRGDEVFGSTTRVRFTATPGSSTFIDALAERVTGIVVNGELIDPATAWDGSRIALTDLEASNDIEVVGEFAYTNTGEGLHRFVDPADGEVYLYTQYAIPDSRRVFTVFEQPDLKATFRYTVTAPTAWEVVSTQPTPEPDDHGDGRATWRFEPTPRLASYATALVAGPYAVTRASLTSVDGREIPLGLLIRRSLAEFADADEFFDVTRRGFAYYEQKFDRAYPFDKYDQIYAPEMNFGAMENAGAVTFNEKFVFRGPVSDAAREQKAVTILHELAHMWFGDLVTMKWWNDLWLNESFADWASAAAATEATDWTTAWTSFHIARKSWGYQQDQLPSTHPVMATIDDLDDVQSNVDGITYAKGASVLKQLVAWVGADAFDAGVAAYFAAHAFGSTELSDLVAELEKASGRDLGEWSTLWLETAGVATLRPEVEVDDDGVITSFAITQTAPADHPTLRPHRIAVGVYDHAAAGSDLVRAHRVEVDIDGARTDVPDLVGVDRGALVLLNDDDLTYAKIRLDPASLETATRSLSSIADPLARALVWGALWDTARDAELAPTDYVRTVLAHLGAETNSAILRTTLAQLVRTVRTYVEPSRRAALRDEVASSLWSAAAASPAGSDGQLQFVSAFAEVASAPEHAERLRRLLDGDLTLDGLTIDSDLRWQLLTGLVAAGGADETEIDALLAGDTTATGLQAAARARAAIPTTPAKRRALAMVVGDAGVSNGIVRAAAQGFSRADDPEILRPLIGFALAGFSRVWESRGIWVGSEFAEGFWPAALADRALADAGVQWLAEHAGPSTPAALRRVMAENLDATRRALRAQAAD
ncbi:aminopeptidase N [Frondihabitans australicus]|uniref:Aminopeptidase N n=1 Tax=Frondihabitans australicus TaxID=386892 RepID=A0A495IC41_9MICO|nr:aminopeptidase N [Frondihabitans australicus]RKR73574.1 membrane alanyl aminopeptidase [Frondihabitans australicus]